MRLKKEREEGAARELTSQLRMVVDVIIRRSLFFSLPRPQSTSFEEEELRRAMAFIFIFDIAIDFGVSKNDRFSP